MSILSPEHPVPRHERSHPVAIKITAWIAVGLVALTLLLVIAAAVVVHNKRFHNYLLATAEKQASEALGTKVVIQNFAVNLSDLSIDLYGLTVSGAEPYPDPPLLQVQHAVARVRIVSALSRKWYLDRIRVDSPVVRIFKDAQGRSNIPTLKSSSSSGSNTSVFDLGVRNAILDHGEVYYNDRQSPLEAELHDVEFSSSFNVILQRYSGRLSYSDGRFVYGSYKPVAHNLEAQFDATPSTFHLTQAKLTSGPSRILLDAASNSYSSPQVQGHYDVLVDGSQFRQLLDSPSIPTGLVHASGQLEYHQDQNRTLIDSLTVNGDLDSASLNLRTPSLRAQVKNLVGHYSLQNGNATLQRFRAHLMGGEVTAEGEMNSIDGASPHSNVRASAHGLSLADLKRAVESSALPPGVNLGGQLSAKADASWGKTLGDLVAHADATIDGKVSSDGKSGAAPGVIPIKSVLHAIYTGGNQQLALSESFVSTPQSNLTMNGVVSNRSSLNLHFQCNDLAELETIADLLRTPVPGQPLRPLGLAGTATFQGTVTGSTFAPDVKGALLASNFRIHGSSWRVLRTNLEANPSFASLQGADLEPASRGKITFNASTGLVKWAFTDSSPVQLDLEASQLNVTDLASLAGSSVPVTGIVAANIKLHGSELNPIGQGNISLAQMKVYDEPVRTASLTFAGTGDEAHGDLSIELPAGKLQSKVSVRPREKTYTAQITSGGIDLDRLQMLKAKNIDATGQISLKGSGQGSFDNPQMVLTVSVPQLVIQHQTINQLQLQADLANHVAIANLTSQAVGTSIKANAKVNITGDYFTEASLDTQALPLQPLLALYNPEQAADLSGETEIHATLRGPLKNKKLLEGHVTIPTLNVAYGTSVQLAAVSPIHADYKDGIVTLQHSTIRGTDTDLQFEGSIPTDGTSSMSFLLLGNVNLHLLQVFDSDIASGGQLKFNINSKGVTNGPNFGGQIEVVDASFSNGDLPVGLQHGNGTLTLTGDRLNINNFQARIGGGTLIAQGGVAYRPTVQFDLGLALNDARMLYPQGVREGVDANLRLSGTTDNAILGGQVNLTDLSFTSAFDLTDFINQFSGGVAAPPTPGFGQNLQLNVAVRSSSDINLVSRTLSIDGSANLQVRGTAAQPVILGRINLNSGDLIFNGSRFVLDGGTIQFVNPSETEPVVNVSINTSIQQYNIFMRFTGPIDQLRTNYSSDPSLPAADIINLLAFGQTTEANSANPSTPANQAAESLVASQVSSQITSRVSKVAGISQLSINPVLAGGSSQGPPGANITIQQRVTGHLFVTFSTNVASTQNQTISTQYQLSRRFGVSATRNQNGGFALDATIKHSW